MSASLLSKAITLMSAALPPGSMVHTRIGSHLRIDTPIPTLGDVFLWDLSAITLCCKMLWCLWLWKIISFLHSSTVGIFCLLHITRLVSCVYCLVSNLSVFQEVFGDWWVCLLVFFVLLGGIGWWHGLRGWWLEFPSCLLGFPHVAASKFLLWAPHCLLCLVSLRRYIPIKGLYTLCTLTGYTLRDRAQAWFHGQSIPYDQLLYTLDWWCT